MEEKITIEIVNWHKHQASSDRVRHPRWFKVQNDIATNEAIVGLPPTTKWVWVCLLAEASRGNGPRVDIEWTRSGRRMDIRRTDLVQSITRLQARKCLKIVQSTDSDCSLEEKRREEKRVYSRSIQTKSELIEPNGSSQLALTSQATKPKSELVNRDTGSPSLVDPPPAVISAERIVALWNSIVQSPRVAMLSAARRRKLSLRAREMPEERQWELLFRKVRNTPFLTGENNRNWRATLDFVIRSQDNVIKIMEDSYGNPKPKQRYHIEM